MFLHARFTKFRRTAWQELNQNCALGTSSESFHATGVHFVRPRMLASHCAQVMASCTSCTLLRRATTAAWSSTRSYRNIFIATAVIAEFGSGDICVSQFPSREAPRVTSPTHPGLHLRRHRVPRERLLHRNRD